LGCRDNVSQFPVSMKCRSFLHQLRDYQLVKYGSAPWRQPTGLYWCTTHRTLRFLRQRCNFGTREPETYLTAALTSTLTIAFQISFTIFIRTTNFPSLRRTQSVTDKPKRPTFSPHCKPLSLFHAFQLRAVIFWYRWTSKVERTLQKGVHTDSEASKLSVWRT
jgi:hypothetical protein